MSLLDNIGGYHSVLFTCNWEALTHNRTSVNDSIYIYAPNKVAPAIFVVIFFLSLVGHLYQC